MCHTKARLLCCVTACHMHRFGTTEPGTEAREEPQPGSSDLPTGATSGSEGGMAVRDPDFDLRALYHAIDDRRRSREMSWSEVAREVNRFNTAGHPIAASTITGLESKTVG